MMASTSLSNSLSFVNMLSYHPLSIEDFYNSNLRLITNFKMHDRYSANEGPVSTYQNNEIKIPLNKSKRQNIIKRCF